ncbi:hypothetical protein ACMFMG_006072 [Clarireedia jacksonii]
MDQESPDIMSEEPEYEFDTPSLDDSDADRACSPKPKNPIAEDSASHGVPLLAEPPSTTTEEHSQCLSNRIPKPQLTSATNEMKNGQPQGAEPFSPSKDFKFNTIISRVKVAKINVKSSVEKTLEDVREESLERGKDIWRAWAYLNKILERHELSIRKRWTKLTNVKRSKILQKVWPKISEFNRPHMIAFALEPTEQRIKATNYRDAYLLPHINLRDLANNKKNLLMFLNKRGRCNPSLFSRTDWRHMKPGTDHLMLLEDEQNYGSIVTWKNFKLHVQGRDWSLKEGVKDDGTIWYGLGFTPMEGLLVLEIQQRTLHFLIGCCQEILSNLKPDELVAGDSIESVNLPSPVDGGGDTLSIAAVGHSKFYSFLERPSFTRLKDILYARRALAEDHLWLLKSDPEYFSQQLQTNYEHDFAHIPDQFGKLTSRLGKPDHWDSIIMDTICTAYENIVAWNALCRVIWAIESLMVEIFDQMSVTERISEALGTPLLLFKYTLKALSHEPSVLKRLKEQVTSSPGFRSCVEWHSCDLEIVIKDDMEHENFLYHISLLWEPEGQERWGLYEVMNNIDAVTLNSQSAKKQATPHVAELLADMGLRGYVLSELENFQPWMMGATREVFEHFGYHIRKSYQYFTQPIVQLDRERNSVGRGISKFGDPTDGRFDYPKEEERTQSNVETLRAAEQSLDNFWAELGKMLKFLNKDWDALVQKSLDSSLKWTVDRTPEWTDPVTDTKEADVIIMGRKVEPNSHTVKTPNFCPSEDIPYIMSVPPKALNVFSIILCQIPYGAIKKSQKKIEVPWTDFVSAMAAVGFGATKFHCSLWHFVPEGVPVSEDHALLRSIMIHEPWENSKISLTYARWIGMRLKRMYGWNMDMFIEEGRTYKDWDAYRFHDYRGWKY